MRSKTLLTALAVILILAAGAYFVGMPMINQHYAKKLQNELNKLPGCSVASIDSKGFGQNFIIKDLRLRFDTLDEYTFMESHIEKAEINGLNISAFSATTTNLLFDEIVITGATNLIKSTKYETIGTPATEDEATTIMAMNSSSMTIRGMKLNVPAFNAYINSGEFEKAIYNSGFYIDYMSGHNMLFEVFSTYSGESEFSLSFASHIAKNNSALAAGYSEITGVIAKSFGIPIMTVAKISCDASSTPNITVLEYVKDPAMIPEILDRIFQESPLKITNMQVSEMFFPRGSNPGASLGLIKMDMDINNQTGKMNLAIDNISIPAGMEKDWEGNPFPPQDLNGNMLLNLSSKREGRTFTLNIAPFDLKLEKLGEASYKQTTSFAADGDIPGLWFFNLMDSNSLHSMELILKDGGARELLGTLVMAEQKHRAAAPASPAEALVNAATELRREAENENPGIQNIVMVLADFIEKGGTFTMTINPAEPVPTNSFFEIISKVPDSLNIAVTRTE